MIKVASFLLTIWGQNQWTCSHQLFEPATDSLHLRLKRPKDFLIKKYRRDV